MLCCCYCDWLCVVDVGVCFVYLVVLCVELDVCMCVCVYFMLVMLLDS